MLNKKHDTGEMDASTTSKQDNRSPLPFDSKGSQMEIIMAEKRDTDSISSEMTGVSTFLIEA